MTDTVLTTDQKVPVALHLEDVNGTNLGTPVGPVTWSSPDDPTLVTLNISPDTLSAEIVSEANGVATVTITDGTTGLSTDVVATVSAAAPVAVALVADVGLAEAK